MTSSLLLPLLVLLSMVMVFMLCLLLLRFLLLRKLLLLRLLLLSPRRQQRQSVFLAAFSHFLWKPGESLGAPHFLQAGGWPLGLCCISSSRGSTRGRSSFF